jgi:hypothetical protein
MSKAFGTSPEARHNERGSARVRFIIILAVIAVIAYMGFQMIPVWYQSSSFKKSLDESAETTAALGRSGDWLKSQVNASAREYCTPPCSFTVSEPGIRDGRWQVTVNVKRPVNVLPFWTYNYDFEYTAQSRTSVGPQ